MTTYETLSIIVALFSLLVSAYAALSVQGVKKSMNVKGDKNVTAGRDITTRGKIK